MDDVTIEIVDLVINVHTMAARDVAAAIRAEGAQSLDLHVLSNLGRAVAESVEVAMHRGGGGPNARQTPLQDSGR